MRKLVEFSTDEEYFNFVNSCSVEERKQLLNELWKAFKLGKEILDKFPMLKPIIQKMMDKMIEEDNNVVDEVFK